MICSNWACYTKINTIPWFNVFSQQMFIPLVKISGQVAQMFCLIMLGGEILFALNLVWCVGSVCTLKFRVEDEARNKMTKICMCFFLPDTGCATANPALSWRGTSTGAHSSLPGAEPAHAGRAWAGKEVLNRHQISSSRKL